MDDEVDLQLNLSVGFHDDGGGGKQRKLKETKLNRVSRLSVAHSDYDLGRHAGTLDGIPQNTFHQPRPHFVPLRVGLPPPPSTPSRPVVIRSNVDEAGSKYSDITGWYLRRDCPRGREPPYLLCTGTTCGEWF